MSAATPAYLEIVDFIVGNNPEAVIRYQPSPQAQERLAELLRQNEESMLSPDEKSELNHFLELEHILRMAKGKARQILAR